MMYAVSFLMMIILAMFLMRITNSNHEFSFLRGSKFTSYESVILNDWINDHIDSGYSVFKVTGHADFSNGDYDANMRLSNQRAEKVASMFPTESEIDVIISDGGNDGSKVKIRAIKKYF